jgi:ATP-binding cassette, subfamily F, member 3
MLQLSGAGKRFGPRLLFENADWLITPTEKTALVGANGAGKSTLIKILGGMDSLDYGRIQRMRGMSIGYLPQDGLALSGRTVFEECLSVFDELRAMEKEFESLAHALSELDPASAEYATAADRYSHVESKLRHHNVYALDAEVGGVLGGLGFSKEDWTRRTEEFSGGWQMRIALAKLLLEQPDLLLLDEPTNHLDLETRNWLENYLSTWPNGYVLISHDRYFLDVTVNKIVEIWNKGLHFYHGNYEKYLTQKAERRAQLESAYKNQRDHIEHLEAFISRFRYQATKAKQVQSRIKELEKIERIEIPLEEPVPHFSFPQPPPSGRTVVDVSGLAMQYGEKRVLEDVHFTIERGDRIALVGVNGAGKSTLIRLLSGQEQPATGTLKLGHNVTAEYFAQDQYKVLDPDARMLDDIGRVAPKVAEKDLRSLLGCFLFTGDDVFKPLGVLSGGERNRYALARILVSPANFLLLDEPTNHLDLRAKDVLLEAIGKFNGTVIFVSHDRYFIDGLAQKVFEVAKNEDPVRGSHLHVFPGNYEDYLWRKEGGAEKLAVEAAATEPLVEAPVVVAAPEVPAAAAKRVNPIKLRQMQERLAQVEAEIPRVDGWVAETEQALGVFVSADETQRLTEVLEALRDRQAELNSEWEELSLQLEEATS